MGGRQLRQRAKPLTDCVHNTLLSWEKRANTDGFSTKFGPLAALHPKSAFRAIRPKRITYRPFSGNKMQLFSETASAK